MKEENWESTIGKGGERKEWKEVNAREGKDRLIIGEGREGRDTSSEMNGGKEENAHRPERGREGDKEGKRKREIRLKSERERVGGTPRWMDGWREGKKFKSECFIKMHSDVRIEQHFLKQILKTRV